MIEFVKDDIFESGCEALVNPVNTVGAMGAGLAKQFRDKFPLNLKLYKEACYNVNSDNERFVVGTLFWVRDILYGKPFATPVMVVNFPTKSDWRNPSQTQYIKIGLLSLRELIKNQNIKSVAIPALGCGKGQLQWPEIKQLIIEVLSECSNVNIKVYEPIE